MILFQYVIGLVMELLLIYNYFRQIFIEKWLRKGLNLRSYRCLSILYFGDPTLAVQTILNLLLYHDQGWANFCVI